MTAVTPAAAAAATMTAILRVHLLFPLVSQKPSTIMASENSASIEGARTWNSPAAG